MKSVVTRAAWLLEYIIGLSNSRHTGRVVFTVDLHEGGIRGVRVAHVTREEVITPQ